MGLAKKSIKTIFLTLTVLFSFSQLTVAQHGHKEQVKEAHGVENAEKEFDPSDLINHHIADAHDFHILDWDGHAISLPLPIILKTNNGLVAFLSSEFHHNNDGKVVVEKNGVKLVRIHNNIYYADKIHGDELPSILDFSSRPVDLSITKNVFSMLLSVLIILFLFVTTARSYRKK